MRWLPCAASWACSTQIKSVKEGGVGDWGGLAHGQSGMGSGMGWDQPPALRPNPKLHPQTRQPYEGRLELHQQFCWGIAQGKRKIFFLLLVEPYSAPICTRHGAGPYIPTRVGTELLITHGSKSRKSF